MVAKIENSIIEGRNVSFFYDSLYYLSDICVMIMEIHGISLMKKNTYEFSLPVLDDVSFN